MEYQSLRYKFELAVSGMADGLVPSSRVAAFTRLHFLSSYRDEWQSLRWSHEYKVQIRGSARVGLSAGFLHEIRDHGGFTTLELSEMPSGRTNRPPSTIRRFRYESSHVESIVTDPSQGLLVTNHAFSNNGQIGISLNFRNISTFDKHPGAPDMSFECNTQVKQHLAHLSMSISGSKLSVSVEFVGGKILHLLMNWRTFDARWLDDLDVQFIDENLLITARKTSGAPALRLYHIKQVSKLTVIRDYQLPEAWAKMLIGFGPNCSPNAEFASHPDALFYASPSNRVIVVNVHSGPQSSPPCQWLFVRESFFKIHSRKDRSTKMSWNNFAQHCVLKNLGSVPAIQVQRGPYVVGSRVLYIEGEAAHGHVGKGPRLHSIDFPPFREPREAGGGGWEWLGPCSHLMPSETYRYLPPTLTNGAVEDFRVTEDNVVLFLKVRDNVRTASILTFGAPQSRHSRR